MNDNLKEPMLAELRRIADADQELANPQYPGWTVTVVEGFDGSWGVTIENDRNFYRLLIDADGSLRGALHGHQGQRGEAANLTPQAVLRLLAGFV